MYSYIFVGQFFNLAKLEVKSNIVFMHKNSPQSITEVSVEERQRKCLNYMDFLFSMNKVCNDNYDPRYSHVTEEDMVELDRLCGRDVPLEEAIQNPELIARRIKVIWQHEKSKCLVPVDV